jgi:hypothetical protein
MKPNEPALTACVFKHDTDIAICLDHIDQADDMRMAYELQQAMKAEVNECSQARIQPDGLTRTYSEDVNLALHFQRSGCITYTSFLYKFDSDFFSPSTIQRMG